MQSELNLKGNKKKYKLIDGYKEIRDHSIGRVNMCLHTYYTYIQFELCGAY